MGNKLFQFGAILYLTLTAFFISSCNIFASLRSGKLTATSKKSTRQTTKTESPTGSETPQSSADTGDTTPPSATDLTLNIEAVKTTEVVLSWTKATDNESAQNALQYEVRRSSSNNLTSVTDAETNGVIAQAYTTNIDIATLTGPTANTTYYFNVIVKDAAGNKSIFTTRAVLTADITGNALVGSRPRQSMRSTSQRKTFFDEVNKKHWAFWFNGTNVSYGYSADGVTWTSSSTVVTTNEDYAVSYKKIGTTPYVFLVARNGTAATLRRGVIGATSITFDTPVTVSLGAGWQWRPTVAISSQNHIWVAAVSDSTSNQRVSVTRSSNTADGNLSSWQAASTLADPSALISDVVLLPRTNGEMSLIVNGEGTNLSAYLFDGSSWSKSTTGLQNEWFGLDDGGYGSIFAIAAVGSDIYVGGNFENMGGTPNADFLAKWNGSTWEAVASGLNASVRTIVISGNNIYVGGQFTNAGGNANADYIAMWNGASWQALGTGLSSYAKDIVVSGSNVYVGGTFTNAGGNADADYIAIWNGTSWSALGATPLNGQVNSIAISGSNVYAGGNFTDAGGNADADFFALWNGSSWSAVGVIPSGGTVSAIAILGSDVFVTCASGFLMWDGTWTLLSDLGGVSSLPLIAHNNRVYIGDYHGSLKYWDTANLKNVVPYSAHSILAAVVSGSNIYVGGTFMQLGGNTDANLVAMWNGSSWLALGSGITVGAGVFAMAVSGGNLYVTGSFANAGGNSSADGIAVWDGATWSGLGGGINLASIGYAIAVSGASNVYVGGLFGNLGGNANADNIAMWNGSSWEAMGSGLTGIVWSITTAGTDVYVGGSFNNAGGNADADYLAKWNGSAWSAVGTSQLNEIPYAIVVDSTDIYIGGVFTNAGGNADADYIAKWNGTTWSAVGSGIDSPVMSLVKAGTDFYAGGNFTLGDGVARWNGTSWTGLSKKPASAKYVISNGAGGIHLIGGVGSDLFGDGGGYYTGSSSSWLGKRTGNLSSVSDPNTGDVYVTYTDYTGIHFRSLSGTTWSAPQTIVAGENFKGTLSINPETADLVLTYFEPNAGLKTLSRSATTQTWDTVPKTLFASSFMHDPIAHELLSPRGYGLVFWNILNTTTFDLKSYWTP